jgi:hypothetical protein
MNKILIIRSVNEISQEMEERPAKRARSSDELYNVPVD